MRDLFSILIGPVVWLAAFSAIYAFQGWICSTSTDWSGHITANSWQLLLTAVWVVVTATQVLVIVLLHREALGPVSKFTRRVSALTAWTALIAAIWTMFPVAVLPPCA